MTTTNAQDVAVLLAEIDRLKAKLAGNHKVTLKVGEKGGVSMYGINSRFPVTLYASQWERVIEHVPQLKQFMLDHKSELATKE